MRTWPLTEARKKFEELYEQALTDGPQTITRYGKPMAVVMARREFEEQDRRRRPPKESSE
jgi:antitoxin Phd